MNGQDDLVSRGETGQLGLPNKKKHFIHQGNHVTVIDGENSSTTFNGHASTIHQNINYNSLERGIRRKLPQVPNGINHGAVTNGNTNPEIFTHSLPRKPKAHASSSRYVRSKIRST